MLHHQQYLPKAAGIQAALALQAGPPIMESMKRNLFGTAMMVLALDLLLKQLPLGPDRVLIPGVLGLTRVQNTGVAFGLLKGSPGLNLVLTGLIILGGLVWLLRQKKLGGFAAFCAGLMLGGALGNFLDRMINGFVTDYLQLLFLHFPVFNLADVAVTAGALLLMLYILLGSRKEAA